MAKAKTVEGFIEGLDAEKAEIVRQVRKVVKAAAPDASEAIKWAQPVYEVNGPFAYLQAHSGHVNFGFWRGVELDDPEGLLQGTGEKMRHVKLSEASEVKAQQDQFTAWVQQAVQLNIEKGNPTRG